eukprot:CAMPEP_0118722970 /NCGR_PEP_ID=MMETSP0800-20121206/31727_1 /TAXON_ID=210618 ORGANISM="Striatella unipunctata, Strain CCMP2910" /NCGR_SAMPLE_ID=MMETSP0800 /ASSEMBLY_ACC=CAM_ASM_000638 /LENGTH=89 /DNA_ID=CAMNT_0006631311 /DNA_START=452 /DNA_END=721 /DNA_ORIENTATION=+
MMLRDHFPNCEEIPPTLKSKFLALKGKTRPGVGESRQYWISSAMEIGLVDTKHDGIGIFEKLWNENIERLLWQQDSQQNETEEHKDEES